MMQSSMRGFGPGPADRPGPQEYRDGEGASILPHVIAWLSHLPSSSRKQEREEKFCPRVWEWGEGDNRTQSSLSPGGHGPLWRGWVCAQIPGCTGAANPDPESTSGWCHCHMFSGQAWLCSQQAGGRGRAEG